MRTHGPDRMITSAHRNGQARHRDTAEGIQRVGRRAAPGVPHRKRPRIQETHFPVEGIRRARAERSVGSGCPHQPKNGPYSIPLHVVTPGAVPPCSSTCAEHHRF